MEDFTLIMGKQVDKIDLNLPVKDIDTLRVYLCKTLHLTQLSIIHDEHGNKYRVTDFLNDEWVELEPLENAPDPFIGTVVICPEVHYVHGTPSSVNDEYNAIETQSNLKLPMIWLNENYTQREFGRGSSYEREISPQLFFMHETNEAKWKNAEHHRLAIQPMNNLANALVEVFEKDRIFKSIEFVDTTPRPRFGVYIEYKGSERKLVDEDLSGVEMRPTLLKYKGLCKC